MTTAPRFLSASTLSGDAINNPQGDSLGNLKDLMIDTSTGKVAYAVLSFGGILGMGDKLFAVPWESLAVDGDNKCLILNVSKDRLKDAPGFDKDHWPNFAEPAFADQLRGYYR
ncbi:PRC-barrel domain-containing protein [Rhodanobacter ginsengiterrae]|uniref:PRC-barrel domain-containing protein n=1 Tax=Rhodanobacter ginsengiterrae TaxID=2008451 RepID=UPI003CE95A7C